MSNRRRLRPHRGRPVVDVVDLVVVLPAPSLVDLCTVPGCSQGAVVLDLVAGLAWCLDHT